MLENINTENVLFLDIETVPQYAEYGLMPENMKKLWDRKAEHLAKNETDTAEALYERAGIYAEFGKIICISVGFVKINTLKLKSFYGDDERLLLKEFAELLNKHYHSPDKILCGHNAREFDYPYIARRMLVNGVKIPLILDTSAKKPWEVNHLDTMQLWRFGDFKNYTSLNLLTTIFDIPTSKDDIEGKDVAKVYRIDKDIERIVTYCQKDVIAVVQLYLRFKGYPLIKEENMIINNG